MLNRLNNGSSRTLALFGAILFGAILVAGLSSHSLAAEQAKSVLATLMQTPGNITIMRHAIAPFENAPRDGARATPEDLRDCSLQRNLDDKGRDQARLTGRLFADEKITFEHVYTSNWCRCRETADLITGRTVENLPSINSYYGRPDREARGLVQLAELRAHIMTKFKPTDRALLITHGSVIFDLSGWWVDETEAIIVRQDEKGNLVVLGRGVPELEFPTSPNLKK